jgi:ketosteroid isomerase-like protein/catechol 2,3-dioxygenase-like lactoylglutathione lyase family enzyme
MTTAADNKQLLQYVFAELERGNSRPFVDSFADDVTWTIVGRTPWSRTYDGKPAVLAQLLRPLREKLTAPVKVSARRFIADGECVVVEATGEATTTAGHPYNNRYCWIFRVDGGKVRDITEYLDTELVAKALGVPAPGNLEQAVPFFGVRDLDRSARYYVDTLGFEMRYSWRPDGRLRWCWVQRGGAAVMLQGFQQDGPHANVPADPLGTGMSICFMCGDAIALYKEFTARGAAPARPFVGNRLWVTSVTDPDGYRLSFESPTDAPEESEYQEERT